MTRDMELVRKLLRAICDKDDREYAEISIDGFAELVVIRHLELLIQAGYVEALVVREIVGPPCIEVRDLTWEGHEFAGALLADESTWQKMRALIGADGLAKLPFKVVQDIATKAVTAWAMKKLGL